MDVDGLKTFAAVARAGGITRAALDLNTVQSNVTARIRQLEAALGVPLFERHRRGVTLTQAGAQLLPYAERVADLLAEARRAATDGSVSGGEISIGSMETTAALRLPPILLTYAQRCPSVDVLIRTGTSESLISDVLDSRLEGAFVAGPVEHNDLISESITTEDLVLVTAPEIDSIETAIESAGSAGVKIVVFRSGCSYRQRLESILRTKNCGLIRRMELGTLEGIIGCVAAGIGVTLLPRAVVDAANATGQIVRHERISAEASRVETIFVRRSDGFFSGAMKEFISCAKQVSAPDLDRVAHGPRSHVPVGLAPVRQVPDP